MFYLWIFAYIKNNHIWYWLGAFNCFFTKNYVGHAVCFSKWKLDQPSSITPLGRYLQEVLFCWWTWRTQPSCPPTVQIMLRNEALFLWNVHWHCFRRWKWEVSVGFILVNLCWRKLGAAGHLRAGDYGTVMIYASAQGITFLPWHLRK